MSGPRIRFHYTPTAQLRPPELDDLWRFYSATFDTERSVFDAAVRNADEALRFYDAESGALVGMTLVSAWPMRHEGRSLRVIWTGAVCIHPAYRGQNAVQQAGLWRLLRERLRHPLSEIWWFWDTFSFKSYLLCPRNLAEYVPKLGVTPGVWEQGLLDALCRERASGTYDEARRILRSTGKKLRPGIADIPPDLADPHVRYFVELNPDHAEGDRVPVLIPLSAKNVAAIVKAGLRRATRAGRKTRRTAPGA